MHGTPDEFLLEHGELNGEGERERSKGLRLRGQPQVERLADSANLVQEEAAGRSLGFHLELPINPQGRRDLFEGVLGHEHLSTYRERFDAPDQVYTGADRGVLGAAHGADVAHDHAARVYPDAHLELGRTLRSKTPIHVCHGELHGQSTRHRLLRVLRASHRRSKDHHDGIAHDLVDGALVTAYDIHHRLEIEIENLERLVWGESGHHGGEPAQVGHQDSRLPLLSPEIKGLRRAQEAFGYLLGHVASEGATDELVGASELCALALQGGRRLVHLFVDHAIALDESGHHHAKEKGHGQASQQGHGGDRIVRTVPVLLRHPPDDLQVGATRRGPGGEPLRELLTWPGRDDRPHLRLPQELATQHEREAHWRRYPA